MERQKVHGVVDHASSVRNRMRETRGTHTCWYLFVSIVWMPDVKVHVQELNSKWPIDIMMTGKNRSRIEYEPIKWCTANTSGECCQYGTRSDCPSPYPTVAMRHVHRSVSSSFYREWKKKRQHKIHKFIDIIAASNASPGNCQRDYRISEEVDNFSSVSHAISALMTKRKIILVPYGTDIVSPLPISILSTEFLCNVVKPSKNP